MFKYIKATIYLVFLLSRGVFCKVKPQASATQADFAQTSPSWLKKFTGPTSATVATSFPDDASIQSGMITHDSFLNAKEYPKPEEQPPVNHPEVQLVLRHLDFSKVPKINPRRVKEWNLDTSNYDTTNDPDCWWSATLCKKPKIGYIPEDIYICPNKGDWGLNYDDGPYKAWWPETSKDKEYDQPRLYNFLVEHGKQKATLFFVGSNVLRYPAAAARALNDGHVLCSHTWSHPQMTSLTNEEIVAQLYWTQRVIKESTGVTPKCWRPPYGDVDDRVRAIAWQMGMRTILWDQDSFDWTLSGIKANTNVIDGYFKEWINARLNGTDNEHGHITLEHENSNHTIILSEKWLPRIQKAFRVMPIHQCINDAYPYWEESWTYPTLEQLEPKKIVDKNVRIVDKAASDSKKTLMTNAANSNKIPLNLVIFSFISVAAYFMA